MMMMMMVVEESFHFRVFLHVFINFIMMNNNNYYYYEINDLNSCGEGKAFGRRSPSIQDHGGAKQ